MKIDRFIIIIFKKGLILTLMMESPNSRLFTNPNFQNHNNLDNKFNEITFHNKIELSEDGHILLTSFCFKITTNKVVDGIKLSKLLLTIQQWKTGLKLLKKCKILRISPQN